MTPRPMIMTMLSSQPRFSIAQAKAASATAETLAGLATPQTMNATMNAAVMVNRTLSRENLLRWSSTPMPGTSPGWRSSG